MGFQNANKVYQSTNYGLFEFLPWNRDRKTRNKREIRKSFDKHGAHAVIHVILTSVFGGIPRYFIADGQHRFEVLKDKGLPIRFILVEIDDKQKIVEFVASLNNTQFSWGLEDYLKAWCSLGIEAYLLIRQKVKYYRMQLSLILQFYTLSQTNRHNGNFKAGKLHLPDLEESKKLIETYQACDPYLPGRAEWHLHRKFVCWLVSRRPDRQICINMLKNNQFPIDEVFVTLDEQLQEIKDN